MTRRTALVGCGSIASVWASDALAREGVDLVALVDVERSAAEAFAARHAIEGVPVYTDVADAIGDAGVDLVLNVTTPDAHADVVCAALRLGCDVLGEKPMASTPDGVRAVLRTVEETGRAHAVMQNRRYLPQMRAARDALASGAVGRVGFVAVDFLVGAHFSGFRTEMASPLVVDMAVHTFDQARMLTGADAVWASCLELNPAGSWYRGDAAAVCTFEVSDGSVVSYRGSWVAEGAPTSWEGSWRVMGESGTLLWDGGDEVVVAGVDRRDPAFVRQDTRTVVPLEPGGRTAHLGCLDEMYEALAAGRRSQTDCRDNANTVGMVFACLESAAAGGGRVRVPF